VVKQGAREIEANEHILRLVRDDFSGVHEWEFMCECGHESCNESVFLTLAAFVALRDGGEAVLSDGHYVNRVAQALRSEARARRKVPRRSSR
jgi:hypothetical protein